MSERPANQGCFASPGRVIPHFVNDRDRVPVGARVDVRHPTRCAARDVDGDPTPGQRAEGPPGTPCPARNGSAQFANSLEKMGYVHRVETRPGTLLIVGELLVLWLLLGFIAWVVVP